MSLFKRPPRSPFPADMRLWLDRFGRFSLDAMTSGIDNSDLWERFGSLHTFATSDRERFLVELRALVADDPGGFATFGAARLVWEMYGSDCLRIPAALPLIDAGIDFKRSRGLPTALFTGYEMTRIHEQADARRDRPTD